MKFDLPAACFGCLILPVLSLAGVTASADINDAVNKAMAGDHREAGNVARDQYRHPKQTLEFLGLKPDMTVVEIWPSRGWYTEILAPVLRKQGIFFAAAYSMTADRTPNWRKNMHKEFMEKMEQRPDIYDHVVVTELSVPERTTIAPPGTVDMILTFRNVHNWMKGDYDTDMFAIFARTLKKGGILGVIEHRARPGTSVEDMKQSGYVTEEYVIRLAKDAGFILEARSELNANTKDTKDHPAGVWTLPPALRLCRNLDNDSEKQECMVKYRGIGESDRMTLRFRKL